MTASQLFFVGVGIVKEAEAGNFCTFESIDYRYEPKTGVLLSSSPKSPRGGQVTFASQKIESSGSAVGIDVTVTVLYDPNTDENPGQYDSSTSCKINGFVNILDSGKNIVTKQPIKLAIKLDNLKTEQKGASFQLTGTFPISSFATVLTDATATAIKASDKGSSYTLDFYTVEEQQITRPNKVANNQLALKSCNGKTQVCGELASGGGVIVSTDELVVPISQAKLALRITAGTNQDIIPKDRRGKEAQNFFRIYKNMPSFNIGTAVLPEAPKERSLGITKGDPTHSSRFVLDDSSLSPKNLISVFSGAFNTKIPYDKSPNSIGCTNDTLTYVNATVLNNSTQKYLWCNFRPKAQIDNFEPIKMDGSTKLPLNLNFGDYSNFSQLLVNVIEISCDDKGENCDPETEDKNNVFNVAPGMLLDPAAWTDSTWAGFVGNLGIEPSLVDIIKRWWTGLPITFSAVQKVNVIVYSNQKGWENNKDKDTPTWVPEPKDVSGEAQIKNSSVGQTLYEFIIRIISSIITYLMDAIYGIFAFLIVPIIKALLLVRPYQDRFVNVIYPGWLILRNLANIFFIVSLLVVGLRILFQQSAAGAARSFIIRLMLMALLVNFSLVISQGFVGIADTVQSQFFPANSRVLEALGQKLMVDPLKTFRSTTISDTGAFNNKDAELSLSSTLKPLVLLMLSVAAFFAFVAVAAFLAVRLVVLWVLYMVSPIAYVGFVMDETKGYAKKWWNEFFKYLIMTPVLAFFLNIAALSATLFSGNSSSLFPVDQGIAGDVVANALTTITHFITLGFIFAGMKFALSSGTIGSKTIVNYAQKGFNAVMTKPAKWAADATRSAAKTQWGRRFKGGMLDPFAHVEAYKELRDEKTKQAIDKRIASKANKLTPKGMQKDKLRALKYMLRGGSFATDNMSAEKSALEEKASILTQKEKAAMEDRYTTGSATLEENQKLLELLKNGNISKKAAQEKIIKGIDDQTAELEKERDTQVSKLRRDSEAADKKGDTDLADSFKEELEKQKEQYNDRIGHLASAKKAVQDRIDESSGDDILFDEGLKAEIGFAFDSEKFQSDLKDEIAKVNQDKLSLETNELLKKKYGLEFMDVNESKKLLDKAREIDKSISDHIMPADLVVRNARLAREAEAAKNIAHLEGEELRLAFAKAMEDNNMDLAAAIGKKVAQEGEFDELLKMNGYKNNVEDFHKFINKSLASLGPSVRAQVGSEISSLAEKNGDMAIGKAYQVSNGHLTSRNMQEHERKVNSSLAKKAPGDVVKMKPNEMAKQNASGGHSLFQGIIDNFSRMNPDKLRDLKKKMSAETASFITKSDNFQYLSPAAKAAVIEAAGKYR